MTTTSHSLAQSHVLYDAARLDAPDERFFDPQWWAAQGRLRGGAPGRGTTVFVEDGQGQLALRHYRRGGLPGRLLGDRYLWTGLARSRPWREWQLLWELHALGLPVPRPVAARCTREGPFYRADLLTERLAGETLAGLLAAGPLGKEALQGVGRCIRRFHDAGVYHADLNARNILLAGSGGVALLDFDRGERRPVARGWQQRNFARLRRSLEKFSRLSAGFAFDEQVWLAIVAGYEGG